jgi:hypothetical protein
MQPLTQRSQFAPIFAIDVDDLNHDGIKDVFMAGNFYGLKPETGRYDAGYGCTLFGNGKQELNYISPAESGLFVRGEVRDIKTLHTLKGEYIIVARNNEPLEIFKKN